MSHLKQIKSHLQQLLLQAEQIDSQQGRADNALFDRTLFKCSSTLLTPYVKEALLLYKELKALQSKQNSNQAQAEYLSERLVNQITAVQRELATHKLQFCDFSTPQDQTELSELYQELMQHNEWERRLIEMVTTKQQLWQSASKSTKNQAKKALVLTEQRLARCQKSKLAIEKLIESNK